jgi:hypothetical protein
MSCRAGVVKDATGTSFGDFEHGYHLSFWGDADFGDEGFDGPFAFAGGSLGDGVR